MCPWYYLYFCRGHRYGYLLPVLFYNISLGVALLLVAHSTTHLHTAVPLVVTIFVMYVRVNSSHTGRLRWKEEWTIKEGEKKGEVDKAKAREKILAWWKDMRAEYRVSGDKVKPVCAPPPPCHPFPFYLCYTHP